MSNIMDLKNVRNKPSRNGFDLSRSVKFTAKVGELLPVNVIECLPGDKFSLGTNWFSRTLPLNSCAYARLQEHFDWYFVPYHLLWSYFPDWITQMNDPQFADSKATAVRLPEEAPFTSLSNLMSYIKAGINYASDGSFASWKETTGNASNLFGFSRYALANKLLQYLGYGDFTQFPNGVVPSQSNLQVSLFRLLAYQKICQDFYRPQQWEGSRPYLFNVNYYGYDSATSLTFNINYANPLDLHYCLYKKDYFTGLLPRSQYGDVSVVESIQDGAEVFAMNSSTFNTSPNSLNALTLETDSTLNIPSFSVLQLRKAEALQKWKEISMLGDKSYKSQMARHFGVSVRGVSDHTSRYVGGVSNFINIGEVVNTNLQGTNQTTVKGNATGGSHGTDTFECHEHGILMCLYHVSPDVEYQRKMIEVHNTKLLASDFAIPEFDKIGMQVTHGFELNMFNNISGSPQPLGYAPRYAEYKTSYDIVQGAFMDSLKYYTVPKNLEGNIYNTAWSFNRFLRVNPHVVDLIFAVKPDNSVNTDNLIVNTRLNITSVRNLDRDGLPY